MAMRYQMRKAATGGRAGSERGELGIPESVLGTQADDGSDEQAHERLAGDQARAASTPAFSTRALWASL